MENTIHPSLLAFSMIQDKPHLYTMDSEKKRGYPNRKAAAQKRKAQKKARRKNRPK